MTSQNAWVEIGTIPLDACPATSAFSATTMYFTGISSGTSGISAGYINLNKSTGVIYAWTTQVQVHADITYMI